MTIAELSPYARSVLERAGKTEMLAQYDTAMAEYKAALETQEWDWEPLKKILSIPGELIGATVKGATEPIRTEVRMSLILVAIIIIAGLYFITQM